VRAIHHGADAADPAQIAEMDATAEKTFGTVNRVDYVTTKTALIGSRRAVALETARANMTCNAICPTPSRLRLERHLILVAIP